MTSNNVSIVNKSLAAHAPHVPIEDAIVVHRFIMSCRCEEKNELVYVEFVWRVVD